METYKGGVNHILLASYRLILNTVLESRTVLNTLTIG